MVVEFHRGPAFHQHPCAQMKMAPPWASTHQDGTCTTSLT
jgi:hypothetical protein